MKLKLMITVLLYFATTLILSAQVAITASGGEASGTSGSSSYSIGQLVYNTLTGTNQYSLSQGVQQPVEISVVSSIDKTQQIQLNVKVYPNPASNYLILRIEDIETETYKAFLYDLNGMQIKQIKVTDQQTEVDINNLVPSVYFLKVMNQNQAIKTFKIIKK
ncbi:MAG: T9SS type A sorting domain-containing protein [Bacteroidetes bacterium]|nr:T9SS type A sorting domain-containing protein [Bacteroidota bacterium]